MRRGSGCYIDADPETGSTAPGAASSASQKGREIIARLGYPDRPIDTVRGFDYDRQYLNYLQGHVPAAEWRQHLNRSRPAAVFFWYRQSPHPILSVMNLATPAGTQGELPDWTANNEWDPPQSPGIVSVRLDMQGHLIRFNATPLPPAEPPSPTPQPGNPDAANWVGLLTAAGLDSAHLTPIETSFMPPSAFDQRAAWSGSYAEQPDLALQVEAAAWRGRPVFFEVTGPWGNPDQTMTAPGGRYRPWWNTIFILILVLFGGILALRNLKLGRSDIQGAFKLAVYCTLMPYLSALIGTHTLYSGQLDELLKMAFGVGGATSLAYIALEPYVRRRWPQSLISWSRVLAGRLRDPLVGRDVIVGILFGIIIAMVRSFKWGVFPVASTTVLRSLSGMRMAASQLFVASNFTLELALAYLLLLLLLRIATRRDWLAVSLFTLFYVFSSSDGAWQSVISIGLTAVLFALILMRFGLMMLTMAYFAIYALTSFPITLDFSAWYASNGLLAVVVLLMLTLFAFYTSLGGQKVFDGRLLEE